MEDGVIISIISCSVDALSGLRHVRLSETHFYFALHFYQFRIGNLFCSFLRYQMYFWDSFRYVPSHRAISIPLDCTYNPVPIDRFSTTDSLLHIRKANVNFVPF